MAKKKERKPPRIGSRFNKEYKGKNYKMTVTKIKNGIGYKVGDVVYRSPSAAAKSITKSEINGWLFWKIDKKI